MLNFSCFLLLGTRRGIVGWHKIEQVSDEMKYVWPTQWPEWRWHFQTHGSMNVYTVWKKIDQWVWFGERGVKKKRFFTMTEINLSREKRGEGESSGKKRQLEISDINNVCLSVCRLLKFFLQYDQLRMSVSPVVVLFWNLCLVFFTWLVLLVFFVWFQGCWVSVTLIVMFLMLCECRRMWALCEKRIVQSFWVNYLFKKLESWGWHRGRSSQERDFCSDPAAHKGGVIFQLFLFFSPCGLWRIHYIKDTKASPFMVWLKMLHSVCHNLYFFQNFLPCLLSLFSVY